MSGTTRGRTCAEDVSARTRWVNLEKVLSACLCELRTPQDRLIITVPGRSGSPAPKVRFRGRTHSEECWATIESGSRPLDGRAAQVLRDPHWHQVNAARWRISVPSQAYWLVARQVAEVLQKGLGIPDPGLLTFEVQGAMESWSRHFAMSGMTPVDEVPTDPVDAVLRAQQRISSLEIIRPGDRADAIELLRAVVEKATGSLPAVDADGDIVVPTRWGHVHLRVHRSGQLATMYTQVVREVVSPVTAARELAAHHRRGWWSTWVLLGPTVVQRAWITTGPFVPELVERDIKAFLREHARTADAMRLRIAKGGA